MADAALSIAAIIPCRNAAAFVGAAIASARAQSRPVDEVVVVDDASTDGSPEVAEAAGARCVRLGVRSGPAAARNAGVRATGADVLAFLDADDLWEPLHVATLSGLLSAAPTAAVAFGRMRRFGAAGGEALVRPGGDGRPFDARDALLRWNFVPQSGAAVRRAAFWEVGGYPEAEARWFVEDYALWLALAERSPFVASPAVTSLHRVHGEQASRDVARMVAREWAVRESHAATVVAADPGRGALVRQALARVWRDELRQAWRRRDAALFAARLAVAPALPGAAATARRWQLAVRLLGGAWLRGGAPPAADGR